MPSVPKASPLPSSSSLSTTSSGSQLPYSSEALGGGLLGKADKEKKKNTHIAHPSHESVHKGHVLERPRVPRSRPDRPPYPRSLTSNLVGDHENQIFAWFWASCSHLKRDVDLVHVRRFYMYCLSLCDKPLEPSWKR